MGLGMVGGSTEGERGGWCRMGEGEGGTMVGGDIITIIRCRRLGRRGIIRVMGGGMEEGDRCRGRLCMGTIIGLGGGRRRGGYGLSMFR